MLCCNYLFIHLNAVKRVIEFIKSGEIENKTYCEFDEFLVDHIKQFPSQTKYQELQKLLQNPLRNEDWQLEFWELMLKLIEETNQHMKPVFENSLQFRDKALCECVMQGIDEGDQVFLIAGQAHINDQVLDFLDGKQIDYIALIPKKIVSERDVYKKLKPLCSKKDDASRLDVLEEAIIAASCHKFSCDGPMSMYHLPNVLRMYCQEKIDQLSLSSKSNSGY